MVGLGAVIGDFHFINSVLVKKILKIIFANAVTFAVVATKIATPASDSPNSFKYSLSNKAIQSMPTFIHTVQDLPIDFFILFLFF